MHTRPLAVIGLAALVLAAGACGYHLSGTGSLLPAGTKTIAVPAFINSTSEPYVDVEVTKAVTDEFIADGRLQVVDVAAAEVALRCKIVKYEVAALSYTVDSFVQQYKVRIVVDAVLEDQRTRRVLWQERGIEAIFIADYKVVVGDITATKIYKEAAIRKASQDIAWTLRSRVLEGF